MLVAAWYRHCRYVHRYYRSYGYAPYYYDDGYYGYGYGPSIGLSFGGGADGVAVTTRILAAIGDNGDLQHSGT